MLTEILSIVVGCGAGVALLSVLSKTSSDVSSSPTGVATALSGAAAFAAAVTGLVWLLASPPLFATHLIGSAWSSNFIADHEAQTMVWVGQVIRVFI